jgi:hypothetical protein
LFSQGGCNAQQPNAQQPNAQQENAQQENARLVELLLVLSVLRQTEAWSWLVNNFFSGGTRAFLEVKVGEDALCWFQRTACMEGLRRAFD